MVVVVRCRDMRDSLWRHLAAIGEERGPKRNMSSNKDLIEIAIDPSVQFDFSQFVKDRGRLCCLFVVLCCAFCAAFVLFFHVF